MILFQENLLSTIWLTSRKSRYSLFKVHEIFSQRFIGKVTTILANKRNIYKL